MSANQSTLRSVTSAVVAVALLAPPPLLDASYDEQLLAGLRNRRLFSLAESYCQQRLADQSITDTQRAALTIEWIRTRAARAVNSTPENRGPHWLAAHQAARQFLSSGNRPRDVLVQVQDALTHLAHGQLIRQELEAGAQLPGPQTSNATQRALQELRQADRLLTELDRQLTKEVPLRRRRRIDDEMLSAEELFALQNNIRYHLARIYRNRGLCYEPQSADRVDALTRAIEQHRELASRLPDDDQLRPDILIESASCYRLLSKLEQARQSLAAVEGLRPKPEIVLRGRAEAVRLELANAHRQAALEILAKGRTIAGYDSPDLDLAHLEAYTAMAQASASDTAAADQWQKKAVASAQQIERLHGPYWARRANLLLVRSARRSGTSDLETLIRIADNLFLNGQMDQAVMSYERAAQQASADGNVDQQFRLFYQAALVEHQRRNHAVASRRFRELALAMQTHEGASGAHLLAIWNNSQTASRDRAALGEYADSLEEHLATWPDADSANQARQWLGRLREREGSWREAIDLYLEVSPTSDRFAEAVNAASRCCQLYFAERSDSGQFDPRRAEAMAERFEDLLYVDGKLTEDFNDARRTAVVAAARIRLQFIPENYQAAEQVLRVAHRSSAGAPNEWLTTVQSLLVVALAGQPNRRTEASTMLDSLVRSSPELLLEMLEGLVKIAASARQESRAEIGRLQLEAIADLASLKPTLNPTDQTRLGQIEAAALAAIGRHDDALDKYELLARQFPRQLQIQQDYAQLLLDVGDEGQLNKALIQWRKIDRGSRPQSPLWYRAKYSIALTYFKLGDKQRAGQLIQYMQATPPGLDRTSLRPQFEELLDRCVIEQ